MEQILDDLIYEWSYLIADRDARLQRERDYKQAEQEAARAEAALEETLTPEQKMLLERYTEALTAADTFVATSAMLTGGKTALRLLLSLLTV